MDNVWDTHYKKPKSKLQYPDENLVRLLSRISPPNLHALDFGSGSGRHITLLKERGFQVSASDSSKESVQQLQITETGVPVFLTDQLPYSFEKNHFGLIVSWGVFHYNERAVAQSMVAALYDAISVGGYLLGSIRAETDTHLALRSGEMQLTDLKGGYAETYSLEGLKELLKPFPEVEIGYTERTPLGKLEERICHWFFLAKKV